MNKNLGRFTRYGDSDVEAEVWALVVDVAEAVEGLVPHDTLKALVLIGGYGRGEGGVESIAGRLVPHNNLDFLLVTHTELDESRRQRIQSLLDDRLAVIRTKHRLGVDLSIIAAPKLRRSPCLVIWYDMRWGHKTVLGDKNFVPNLTRFRRDRILPWNARDLMVNRGTLLAINQWMIEEDVSTSEAKRTIIKHAMKAVIGYGDALLYFLGDYHWSYFEKQQRMQKRSDVQESFKVLYDQAVEFRFRPDYTIFHDVNVTAWNDEIVQQLEAVQLEVEKLRLHEPDMQWDEYAELALSHEAWEGLASPRELARKAVTWYRNRNQNFSANWKQNQLFRAAGDRRLMSMLFPAVVYDDSPQSLRQMAAEYYGIQSTEKSDLRRAYLQQWSQFGDTNFHLMIKQHGLSLNTESEKVTQ